VHICRETVTPSDRQLILEASIQLVVAYTFQEERLSALGGCKAQIISYANDRVREFRVAKIGRESI